METKFCKKCHTEKPKGSFGRRSENSNWLRSNCVDCEREKSKNLKNRQGIQLPSYYFKICSICHRELSAAMFNRRAASLDKLDYKCKECNKKHSRLAYKNRVKNTINDKSSTDKKQCKCCNQSFSIFNFWKKPDTKDGLTDSCITCLKKKRAEPKAKENHKKHAARTRKKHPDAVKARLKVSTAIRSGLMAHPTKLLCKRCGDSAAHYHHWSYEKEHWLDVEPICVRCHTSLTYSRK